MLGAAARAARRRVLGISAPAHRHARRTASRAADRRRSPGVPAASAAPPAGAVGGDGQRPAAHVPSRCLRRARGARGRGWRAAALLSVAQRVLVNVKTGRGALGEAALVPVTPLAALPAYALAFRRNAHWKGRSYPDPAHAEGRDRAHAQAFGPAAAR